MLTFDLDLQRGELDMQKWVSQGVPGGSKSKAPKQKNWREPGGLSFDWLWEGRQSILGHSEPEPDLAVESAESSEVFQQGSDPVRGRGGWGQEAGEGGLNRERASRWCLSKSSTLTCSGRDLRFRCSIP